MNSQRTSIILFIAVVSLYMAGSAFSPFILTWGDAVAYLGFPTNLVFHHEASFNNFKVAVPPPLYPLLLVPVLSLFERADNFMTGITLLNSLAYASFVFLAFIIGRRNSLSQLSRILLALLLTLTPGAFQYTQDVMTESFYLPMIAFAFYLTVAAIDRRNIYILSVLSFCLLMTKPIALVPFAILAGFKTVEFFRCKYQGRSYLQLFMLWVLPIGSLLVFMRMAPQLADFKGAEYPGGYSQVVLAFLSNWQMFQILLARLGMSIVYILIGSYFLPLLFLLPGCRDTVTRDLSRRSVGLFFLLWLFTAALCATAQGVFFRNPEAPSFYLYGRYIEALVPIATILGFLRLQQILQSLRNDPLTSIQKLAAILMSCIIFSILYFFPYRMWTGISVISLAHIVYPAEFLRSYPVIALIFSFGLLFSLFYKEYNFLFSRVMSLLLLATLLFSSAKEMQRVWVAKDSWRRRITDTPMYAAMPPERTRFLVIDPAITKSKELWYMKGVYIQARYREPRQFPDGKIPRGSIYLTSSSEAPPGFVNCDQRPWANVFCKPKKRKN